MEDLPLDTTVLKPFKSGKCQLCHSPNFLKHNRMCHSCDKYASQDHVSNWKTRSESADGLTQKDFWHDPWGVHLEPKEHAHYRDRFYRILNKAGLSAQQRQIIKLHFCENLSFFDISKKLEISKGSVWNQIKRAFEKLRICRTNPLLVKERSLRTFPQRCEPVPKVEKILPVKFYQPDENGELRLTQILRPTKRREFPKRAKDSRVFSKCPVCSAKAFMVDQDFYYCMDCMWNSDTDQATKSDSAQYKSSNNSEL
jgi:predicted DNA-binding protein YlxM (UPF0122 family)